MVNYALTIFFFLLLFFKFCTAKAAIGFISFNSITQQQPNFGDQLAKVATKPCSDMLEL